MNQQIEKPQPFSGFMKHIKELYSTSGKKKNPLYRYLHCGLIALYKIPQKISPGSGLLLRQEKKIGTEERENTQSFVEYKMIGQVLIPEVESLCYYGKETEVFINAARCFLSAN